MIKENVKRLLAELPDGVELEAACKTRTPEEILEAAAHASRSVHRGVSDERARSDQVRT